MLFFILRRLPNFIAKALVVLSVLPGAFRSDGPRLVEKDDRYALLVDGRPYLVFGCQIHNSAWPNT
jgi:hypothetical protein